MILIFFYLNFKSVNLLNPKNFSTIQESPPPPFFTISVCGEGSNKLRKIIVWKKNGGKL